MLKINRNMLTIWLTVLSITTLRASQVTAQTDCTVGLGMEDGSIPDENITSFPDEGSPAGARLNSANSAWCVNFANITEAEATLTVDLGSPRFVSGVVSQGPPAALDRPDYVNWMRLQVDYSEDGVSWTRCCQYWSQQQTVTFFIKHRKDISENTHGFGELHRARFVRFAFLTSGAMGDDLKCFRLEVLGCPKDWRPRPTFIHTPHKEGWLELQWSQPEALVPTTAQATTYRLPIPHYMLNISGPGDPDGEGAVTTSAEVAERRWPVLLPLWGAEYQATLACWLDGVPLDCGGHRFTAELGCSGQPRCSTEAEFQLPESLRAVWDGGGSLQLDWSWRRRGWRTSHSLLAVTGTGGAVTSQVISSSANSHNLTGLSGNEDYDVFISPVVPHLTSVPSLHRKVKFVSLGGASSRLVAAPAAVEEAAAGENEAAVAALVADVALKVAASWSGHLNATWRPAVAEASAASVPADRYAVAVEVAGEAVFNTTTEETSLLWSGLQMGREHVVSVQCLFGDSRISCGRAAVTPTRPGSITAAGSDWLVNDLPGEPVSWPEAEATCQRRGGHLAAVTSEEEHVRLSALLVTLGWEEAWIGLNMCQDGSAVWTDQSALHFQKFSEGPVVSGSSLCCVRLVKRSPSSMSFVWRVQLCDSLAIPLCASKMSAGEVSPVEQLTAVSSQPLTLDLQWQLSLDSVGWMPTSCLISVCPTRDLAEPERDLSDQACTQLESVAPLSAQLTGLAGYHEFSVSVRSQLITVQSPQLATVTARTLSALPVSLQLTPSGQLTAVWRRKVVEEADDTEVDVVVRELPEALTEPSVSMMALNAMLGEPENRSEVVRQTSDQPRRQWPRQVHWSQLHLGSAYRLELYDIGANSTTDYIEFTALPTCAEGQYQLQNLCFWPSSVAGRYDEGTTQCAREGDTAPERSMLAPIVSSEELQLAETLSRWQQAALWVGQNRRRRDAPYSRYSAGERVPAAEQLRTPRERYPQHLLQERALYPSDAELLPPPQPSESSNSTRPERPARHPEAELLPGSPPPSGAPKLRPTLHPDAEILTSHPGTRPSQSGRTAPPAKLPSSRAEAAMLSGRVPGRSNSVIIFPEDPEAESALGEEPEAESALGEEPVVDADAEEVEGELCRWIEDGAGRVQVTSQCGGNLPYVCRTTVNAVVPAWSQWDIDITPRSSWIRLDWSEPDSWYTEYLVTVQQRPPQQRRRSLRSPPATIPYRAPPVMLRNLTENAVYEVTLVRVMAGQQTTVGPIAIRALDPPRSMFPSDNPPLLFVSMSYIVVIVASVLTLIVLALARMRTVDSVAHGCLAALLAVCYTVLLLANGGPLSESGRRWCWRAAVATQLSFSAAAAALSLQAVVTPHLLLARSHLWLQRHAWTVPLLVLLPQALVALVMSHTARDRYVDGTPDTCWLELAVDSWVLWVQVAHLALLWLVGMAYIVRALAVPSVGLTSTRQLLQPEPMQKRHRTLLRLRYVTLALLLVLPACWAVGAAGFHFSSPPLLWVLAALDVLLALLVAARALADSELRRRLANLCEDTYVARSAPAAGWHRQRVEPLPAPPTASTTGDADTDGALLVKRTFHFGQAGPVPPPAPQFHTPPVVD